MLRDRDADDVWLGLASHVARHGCWPDALTQRQAALLAAGADAVAWDLAFPEVFPDGFSVVLGNPPWDVVLPNTKDFVADYDPAMLDARTPSGTGCDRTARFWRDRPSPLRSSAYRDGFDRLKRIARGCTGISGSRPADSTTAGNLDLFRLFAERNMELIAADGAIGVLMPSAFHANEGTTGIRRLYLKDDRSKLVPVIRKSPPHLRHRQPLQVRPDCGPPPRSDAVVALRVLSGSHRGHRRSRQDHDLRHGISGHGPAAPVWRRWNCVATLTCGLPKRCSHGRNGLGAWCADRHIRFGCDLHMTADAGCFQPAGTGESILHEGKTFHQYTDSLGHRSRATAWRQKRCKPAIAEATRHYRLAFRDIARSNDERTMIACIAPPGVGVSVTPRPWRKRRGTRSIADALVLCALFNSFPFDWLVRQKAATHLSLYILHALPVPRFSKAEDRFLAQTALRCPEPRWLCRLVAGSALAADKPRYRSAGSCAPPSTRSWRGRMGWTGINMSTCLEVSAIAPNLQHHRFVSRRSICSAQSLEASVRR